MAGLRKKIHFIINPRSSGGVTGRSWQELEGLLQKRLGAFTYEFTDAPGAATKLAARALQNKPDVIAVVGGDGTISEVVNGYFAPGLPRSKAPIAVLNRGTGGDFCRTLGIPADLELALDLIKNGRDTPVDVGVLRYMNNEGVQSERRFVNVAGCGLAGEVVEAVNRSSKRFGGLSYFLASAQANLTYQKRRVRITWDDDRRTEHRIVTVAIANGKFFGGGMMIAPDARVGDGLFDVVLIEDWNFLQSVWYVRNLYNGSIAHTHGVSIRRTRRLKIEPVNPGDRILIDCDGENVGFAPLEAELMPAAIQFRI